MKYKFLKMNLIVIVFHLFLSTNLVSATQIVIAHRGASSYLPEHTLSSAVMAYTFGAHFLELDLIMTKDGHLITLHDLTLNATTDINQIFPDRARSDGKFYAVDFNLSEVKQLKVHERFAKSGTGQAFKNRFPIDSKIFVVPTLEEMLQLIQGLESLVA